MLRETLWYFGIFYATEMLFQRTRPIQGVQANDEGLNGLTKNAQLNYKLQMLVCMDSLLNGYN
jgi:hypothetical protein